MFRHTRGRMRRRGFVLAATALLATAFGAVQASSAAALGEQCSGKEINVHGAFLQEVAQSVWTGTKAGTGFNGSGDAAACSGTQGSKGKPKVSYVPVGSGSALHGWGSDDGIRHSKTPAAILTDEPPAGPVGEEGTQLANMKAALGSDVVMLPVTQTAIAIVAHPPKLPSHSQCLVPRVAAPELQQAFAGLLTNWRQFSAASDPEAGGDCDQAVTRAVGNDLSGTAYQFKHFLDQVNSEPLQCTGETPKTWAQLQSSREPGQLNRVWPEKSKCQEGQGPVTVVDGVGEGSAAVEYVAKNAGTITFGALPTVMAGPGSEWVVRVGNGAGFADPYLEGEANCAAAKYTLPSGWETGLNVDWSQVYGSDPAIGEEAENAYPICTLSWAVAAADSGGLFGTKAGTTVRDYLKYVLSPEGGQSDVLLHRYAPLPEAVAGAAAAALAQIGGEGEEEGEEEEGGGGKTGTVLCKVAPEAKEGVLLCPKEQGFTGIKVSGGLFPEAEATFESTSGPGGTVTCPEGEYTGEFDEDGTASGGGIVHFVFGQKAGCTTTFPEESEAIVRFMNPNYDMSKFVYIASLAPQGAFALAKGKGGAIELRIESNPECTYVPTFLSGQVVNGSPSWLIMTGSWQWIEGPEESCPKTLQQHSQLTVTQGGGGEGPSLYVAGE